MNPTLPPLEEAPGYQLACALVVVFSVCIAIALAYQKGFEDARG